MSTSATPFGIYGSSRKRFTMQPHTSFGSNFSGAAFCLPHQLVGFLFLSFITNRQSNRPHTSCSCARLLFSTTYCHNAVPMHAFTDTIKSRRLVTSMITELLLSLKGILKKICPSSVRRWSFVPLIDCFFCHQLTTWFTRDFLTAFGYPLANLVVSCNWWLKKQKKSTNCGTKAADVLTHF